MISPLEKQRGDILVLICAFCISIAPDFDKKEEGKKLFLRTLDSQDKEGGIVSTYMKKMGPEDDFDSFRGTKYLLELIGVTEEEWSARMVSEGIR